MSLVTDETDLNNVLEIEQKPGEGCALHRKDAALTLPGQARIFLQPDLKLLEYLRKEHQVPYLDRAAPWLGLVSCVNPESLLKISADPFIAKITTPSYEHIFPLHHQSARGRRIIVVENPYLHLVWYYDRIFIKPIPQYLLSAAFWQYLKQTDQELWKAAAGFMRTYSYLIKYETDFEKAQSTDMRLIPQLDGEKEPITFERFVKFIAPFENDCGSLVCGRYDYGELRLSRLNIWAFLLFRKVSFHYVNTQSSFLLAKLFAWVLTAFLVLNVILTSMQVDLAVQSAPTVSDNWNTFGQVSRLFSIIVIISVALLIVCFLATILFGYVCQVLYAWRVINSKDRHQIMDLSSVV